MSCENEAQGSIQSTAGGKSIWTASREVDLRLNRCTFSLLLSPTNWWQTIISPPTSPPIGFAFRAGGGLLVAVMIQVWSKYTTIPEERIVAAISPFCASLGDVRRGAHTCQNSLLDHRYCKLKRNSQSVDQNIYISSVMLICHYFTWGLYGNKNWTSKRGVRRRQYAAADQTSRQYCRWGSIEGICGGSSSESMVCGECKVGSDGGSIRTIGLLN